MRSFRQYAVAAAFAFATVAAGSAPAFAWGAGIPDSAYSVYYDQPAPQVTPRTRTYYNYVAPRQQQRNPALSQSPATGSNVGANDDSVPPIGGWW
jgi:hypothetical protein